ncbi:homeodomain-like protein [Tanacetum coccineum]
MAISNPNGTVGVTNGDKINPKISAAGLSEHAMKHYVPFPAHWSREEKSLLENLIVQYASDKPVLRYAKIAGKLQDKTVRDVALRCRWMSV